MVFPAGAFKDKGGSDDNDRFHDVLSVLNGCHDFHEAVMAVGNLRNFMSLLKTDGCKLYLINP